MAATSASGADNAVAPCRYDRHANVAFVPWAPTSCKTAPDVERLVSGSVAQFESTQSTNLNVRCCTPLQPVSRFVGSEEILLRDHADVATFVVKKNAYIDNFTRKYLDEINAYRLPRYDTPAVKIAASDVPNMSESGQFALTCGSYGGAGLWIARNSRPEISFVVGWLGRCTTKWTREECP